MEQICAVLPAWRASFYRTATGEEMDLILDRGGNRLAFEFKASADPHLSDRFAGVVETLAPDRTWVVCPVQTPGYSLRAGIRIAGIAETLEALRAYR